MRVRATFAERFELANFPVDRQDLKVKVRSRQEAHLVHFSTPSISDASDRSQVLVDKFVREGEWELSDILRLRVGESRPTESLSQPPKVYPELHLQMRVVRKPWNYLFDVVLPLGLISLGSITSLVVPRADLGDRLAITVTMILTSITFKTITQRTLPVLSYQTLMDYYILTMFVFIFAVLVVNLAFLTPIFEERWQGLLAYPDDLQAVLDFNRPDLESRFAVYFVLFLGLAHVVFLLWLWLMFEINRAWCMELDALDGLQQGASRLSRGLQQREVRHSSHASSISATPSAKTEKSLVRSFGIGARSKSSGGPASPWRWGARSPKAASKPGTPRSDHCLDQHIGATSHSTGTGSPKLPSAKSADSKSVAFAAGAV